MATGKVSNWNADRGFGFIKTDAGDSHFAHINNFNPRIEPEIGQRVQFEVVQDDRKGKSRADNVRPI
jgi:cold shock CspA family protein